MSDLTNRETFESSSDGDPTPVEFGAIFRERRIQQGFSQADLADAMNTARATVIRWEQDKSKPDYTMLPKLCRLLNIRPDELFGFDSRPEPTREEDPFLSEFRSLSQAGQNAVVNMIHAMLEEKLDAKRSELAESFLLLPEHPASAGDQVAPAFLRRNQFNEGATGIIRLTDDGMEPAYHKGDFVYYEAADAASPEEDILVETEDGIILKRVDWDQALYYLNPDYPEPEETDDEPLVFGHVLGIVASSDRPRDEDLPLLEEIFADDLRAFREEYDLPDPEDN